MQRLHDAWIIDGEAEESLRCSPRLSLHEMLVSGLPAVFLDFGETLLFLNGKLFNLGDVRAARRSGTMLPMPLRDEILACGVGLEYGWRHLGGCTCPLCAERRLGLAA